MAAANTRPPSWRFREAPLELSFHRCRCRRSLLGALFLNPLVPLRAKFKESLGFFVQPLTLATVECGAAQNAEHSLGAEIVLIVKTMHHLYDFIGRKPGVLD